MIDDDHLPKLVSIEGFQGAKNLSKHFSSTKISSATCEIRECKSGLTFAPRFARPVNYMQYGGGCSLRWRLSISTMEGTQYGCVTPSVRWRMCSTVQCFTVQTNANADVTCLISEYIFPLRF